MNTNLVWMITLAAALGPLISLAHGGSEQMKPVTENRVAEILKYCTLAEEGGFGYQREGNLSIQDKESFQEWFKNQDDPLESIN